MSHELTVAIKKPYECSQAELQDFVSLVLAGGEVTAAGLEERVRKAQFLVFLTERDCLKGIAAVKNPALGYRRGDLGRNSEGASISQRHRVSA